MNLPQGVRPAREVISILSKIGMVVFFLILIVAAFGVISFACEFFLGRPLVAVIKEFLFLVTRKA